MGHVKKILLNFSIVPLTITAPTVIAISCSNSIIKNNNLDSKKILSKTPYSPVLIYQLKIFFDKFVSKFDVEGLKLQALKTSDAGLIAFGGYLVDSNDKKIGQLKAKEKFAKNIKIFKKELDILFDATIGKPELATNIISPIINKNVKDQKIRKLINIVIENILKKIKMVMDNVMDTIINIEHPIIPDFIKKSKLLGTLEDVKKNKSVDLEKIKKAFKNGFNEKNILFKRPEGEYDILHNLGFFTKSALEIALGTDLKLKKQEQELKGSAWQIGVKMLQNEIENNPKNVLVYKDDTNNRIYFEQKTKTNKLANEIKTKIKFNEKHMGSTIDDKIINQSKSLLNKFLNGNIGLVSILGEIGNIKNILKDKVAIYSFIERAQLILEDFGKTIQFAELNLQMISSNLLGNESQYYGGLEIKNDSHNYTLLPDSFITPQFNIYKYDNYKPYNENVDRKTMEKGMKIIANAGITSVAINVLEVFKNITKDPLSNYTVGVFQIIQLLTKDMDNFEIGI